MEERRNFFTGHYEFFLIAAYIALMAMVIFFLALSTGFQIGLLIASALVLVLTVLAAGLLPAGRAASIQPMEALRTE